MIDIENIRSLFQKEFSPSCKFGMINELKPLAYGLALIRNDDIKTLFGKQSRGGMRTVCGPSTELGLAGLKTLAPTELDVVKGAPKFRC